MWYLCVFFHRLLDYRKPEVESLAYLFGVNDALEWKLPKHHHPDSPFHFVNLPSEDIARSIANRSILVKGMYEVWGEGSSYEELEKEGRVNLKNPDHKFWLIETDDYGVNNGLPPVAERRIFFGREIGAADRKLIPTYQLKSRNYLGPTAMDAEVAFWPTRHWLNLGNLSMTLLSALGVFLLLQLTSGADIDIRVVRDGRGPILMFGAILSRFEKLMWAMVCIIVSELHDTVLVLIFLQYGLQMPIGLLRQIITFHLGVLVFDAIICDPPYGVRASGRKLLKGVLDPYTVPDDKRVGHIPSTAPYCLSECVHDLLDLAGRILVMDLKLTLQSGSANNGEDRSVH
ncbi:UPF0020 domain-containing protein [Citrus sinensis]|uniref:UPF0020 domain-containing protein n=1 Tax=Citrus sinensis TaxID=2711 RepID=A0ACB8NWZ3_CITSI|nr:UPF0020 domain-containing protein [Citrus sinensis]